MSRVVGLFLAIMLAWSSEATAGTDNTLGGGSTSAETDPDTGEVGVEAGSPGSGGSGGSVGSGAVKCTWRVVTLAEAGMVPAGAPGSDTLPASPANASAPYTQTKNGVLQIGYWRMCPGKPVEFRFIDDGVGAADLRPGLRDKVSSQLPMPSPEVSPVEGIVNLGMWLAVAPVAPVVLTAEAGPAWITMRAEHTSTTFGFGNGDEVTCEGIGTPIVELDTVEEGPCGYTYRAASPSDEPYQLTVATTWALRYTSSDGPGTLPPLVRSTTIDYPVREIQTIGVQG